MGIRVSVSKRNAFVDKAGLKHRDSWACYLTLKTKNENSSILQSILSKCSITGQNNGSKNKQLDAPKEIKFQNQKFYFSCEEIKKEEIIKKDEKVFESIDELPDDRIRKLFKIHKNFSFSYQNMANLSDNTPNKVSEKTIQNYLTGSTKKSIAREICLFILKKDENKNIVEEELYLERNYYEKQDKYFGITLDEKSDRLFLLNNNAIVHNCINYVNEKLQQIFIELTLKAEQEEYSKEGIKWEPIKFFNNKIVCDLIEARKPPGIMSLLDDICATTKSMSAEQADGKFQQKLGELFTSHPHLHARGVLEFIIKHYAGDVSYNVTGFTEKNNDDLFDTLIETMKFSKCEFYASLFPENVSSKNKKRPPTSGFKIKNSCSDLVIALNKCVPHYIRCIKPNENKKPREMDAKRTTHQIQYLGLIENIRVRRAGFAYRTEYESFLERFGLLSKLTWPSPWKGEAKEGCIALLNDLNIDEKEWQLGKTKIFLRHPETLFQLEDLKERKFHNAASLIQRKYKQYKLKEYFIELRNTVNDALYQKKERRALSLNKQYLSDYLQYSKNAQLQTIMKEYQNEGGVLFSDEFFKPVRKFIGHRVDKLSLLVTPKSINFIERIKEKKQFVTKIVHKIRIDDISSISLSTLSDNFIVIHSKKSNTEEMFGENVNKTELISVLFDQYRKLTNQDLSINFSDSIQYTSNPKGKKKIAAFIKDKTEKNKLALLSGSSTKWTISIATGLPSDSKPKPQEVKVKKQSNNQQQKKTYQQKQVNEEPLGFGVMESVPTTQHVDRPKRPPPSLPKKKEAPKPQVKALFDYDAAANDEITIKEGDIINLIQKSETGWWEGELNGKTGLFPGTYVEQIQ